MSWAEIKKALNSTIGTTQFDPLDKKITQESYDTFYNLSKFANVLLGADDGKAEIIPYGVTEIEQAKYMDGSMEIVVIPSTVKKIGTSAFNLCLRLKHVFIPNSVTVINSNAFANCTKLENIFIPSSVENIGSGVFSTCPNLTDIYIDRPETQAIEGAPWGATNATIHYKT